jgi:O-antigen ligase
VYLGLSGGGYDIVVRSEIGLLVWWFVLLGALIGLLPRAQMPRAGWIAAGLLCGFLIWTWIGLSWSSSHELTLDEVCRLSTYLGVLVLGLCAVTPENARALINGLGCGIAAVSTVAIMSKLAPGLFPADTARSFYQTARLSYPFDYADGVGEYAALGLPLVLYMATSGRTLAGRALATGALQPILLCLAMTVSRGGILAAFVGVIAFLALVPNRIPRLPTFAITAAGIAILMLSLLHRAALRDSTSAAPGSERHSMLLILCAVVAAAVVVQALALLAMRRLRRPHWLQVSRRGAQGTTAAIVVVVTALVIVGFAAGTVSHLWHDFKLWEPTAHSNQYLRLLSLAGSHRYQYWQVAWKAFRSSPFHGIGAGTFRFYWGQHTTHIEYIQNAHSLWFETLAETGIVGWLLIAGFFGLVVVGGIVRTLRARESRRVLIATATAGVLAFCAAAGFDWVWQIGVVPMVTMLLVAVTVLPESERAGQSAASGPRASWALPSWIGRRLALGLGSVLALILIAIPLASTVALRASQSAATHGQLKVASADANTARAIEPGAASPYLQRALLLEQQNDISGAAVAIAAAIAREPTNYTLWLEAERIATESNRPQQALADYRRAQELYPSSTVFIG